MVVAEDLQDDIQDQAASQHRAAEHAAAQAQAEADAKQRAAEAKRFAEAKAKAEREAAERAAREEERKRLNTFVAPVDGSYVSTQYKAGGGMWSSGSHTGIDFHAASGTTVHAVGAGVVVEAGWGGAYGNNVVIKHNDGTYTQYGHMSSLSVSVGEQVTPASRSACRAPPATPAARTCTSRPAPARSTARTSTRSRTCARTTSASDAHRTASPKAPAPRAGAFALLRRANVSHFRALSEIIVCCNRVELRTCASNERGSQK